MGRQMKRAHLSFGKMARRGWKRSKIHRALKKRKQKEVIEIN
jgi:hypothetical protein